MPDSLPPNNDGLDDEFELEPVDPEILANQRRLADLKTDQAQTAVDEELILRSDQPEDPLTLEELKNFHFTRRHLLIATALLALIMAICQLAGTGAGLFITAALAVSAGWLFTMRRQQHHDARIDQLRHDLEARREANNQTGTTTSIRPDGAPSPPERYPTSGIDPRPGQILSFSMKEMLLAVTAAAILLALIRWLGPGPLAIMLGMIAFGGLVAQVAGLEAPPMAVFFWWILLVLYLLLGFWHSATPNDDGACLPANPSIYMTG
jgi:hypothetical protein